MKVGKILGIAAILSTLISGDVQAQYGVQARKSYNNYYYGGWWPHYGYFAGGGWPYSYGYGGWGYPSDRSSDDRPREYSTTSYVVAPTYTYAVTGSSSVIAVQRRLARAGYYHGPIDGIMGPMTRSALARFEQDRR